MTVSFRPCASPEPRTGGRPIVETRHRLMRIVDDLTQFDLPGESIITIGAFDGLHRGHQALIGHVLRRARETGCTAALVTFHPHPAAVLAPERAPLLLTTPAEKAALLEEMGLDLMVLLPFDRPTAATPARAFMETLCAHLHPREIWVGADFALGRGREGDVAFLSKLGRELGYQIRPLQPVRENGQVISSSRIRALLERGDVEEAGRLLGRHPRLSGEVVYGAQRGRTLGFPTANLEIPPGRAVPANGVYATLVRIGEERYRGVTNVGVRPSFDNGRRTVETHIFDFDEDIYGCRLTVEFIARLRDERRFENIGDLVAQIRQDGDRARRLLARYETSGARSSCPYHYREVPHTADRALQVWGRTLPDLFVGAARGMYSLMAEPEDLLAVRWQEIQLEAPDRETLLVDWLNELLFLTEVEELLFAEFRITSLNGTTLQAQAGGTVAPIGKAHIKAATFHDLRIVREGDGWSALITFDV